MENESRNKEKKSRIIVKKTFSVFVIACGITIAIDLLFFALLSIATSGETGGGFALLIFLGIGLAAISIIVLPTAFISGLFYAFRGRKSGTIALASIPLLLIFFCIIFWPWADDIFWMMLG